MRTYLVIIVIICCCSFNNYSQGQTVNSESTFKADTAQTQISVQRVEINVSGVSLKYDFKSNGSDIIGLVAPKIISDSTFNWGGMIAKTGDGGSSDQLVLDSWVSKKFGKLSTSLEVGRIINQLGDPWDCAGGRLSYGNFTAELYELTYHPIIGEKITGQDATYGWLAYHPQHAFVALGKSDHQYWGLLGTRNLQHFGEFAFVNYVPETGDFWFRSQTGFGEINQKFFCQDLYIEGTSYLVVPAFYYKHFSPICPKGTYALRLEGRRTGSLQNYEAMMGKRIGNDVVRLAAGVNSEYRADLRLAPSFELYKSFKTKSWESIIELRYDMLYKALSGYLIVRY